MSSVAWLLTHRGRNNFGLEWKITDLKPTELFVLWDGVVESTREISRQVYLGVK